MGQMTIGNTIFQMNLDQANNDFVTRILQDNATIPDFFYIPPTTGIELTEDIRSWISVRPVKFLDLDSLDPVTNKPTVAVDIQSDYYNGELTNDPSFKIFQNTPYIIDEGYEGQIFIDGETLFVKRFTVEWQILYVTMCEAFDYLGRPERIEETYEICRLDERVTAGGMVGIIPVCFTDSNVVGKKYFSMPSYQIGEAQLDNISQKILHSNVLFRLFVNSETLPDYFKRVIAHELGNYSYTGKTYTYIGDVAKKQSEMGLVHNESTVQINRLMTDVDQGGFETYTRNDQIGDVLDLVLGGNPLVPFSRALDGVSKKGTSAYGYYDAPPTLNTIQRGHIIAGLPENSSPRTFKDQINNSQDITIRGRFIDSSIGQLDSLLFADWFKMRPMLQLYQLQHKIHYEHKRVDYGVCATIPPLIITPHTSGDWSHDIYPVTINGYEVRNVYLWETFQADIYFGAYYNYTPHSSNVNGQLGYYDEERGDDIFDGLPRGVLAGGVLVNPQWVDAVADALEMAQNPFSSLNWFKNIWVYVIIGVVIAIIVVIGYYLYKRGQKKREMAGHRTDISIKLEKEYQRPPTEKEIDYQIEKDRQKQFQKLMLFSIGLSGVILVLWLIIPNLWLLFL